MGQSIREYEISRTYDNVILTQITESTDTDGIPLGPITPQRTGNTEERNAGRIQDGFGTESPLVLFGDCVEIESDPITAFSPIRRADVVGLQARTFINNLIWS